MHQNQQCVCSVHTFPARLSARDWQGTFGSSNSVPCCVCPSSHLLPPPKTLQIFTNTPYSNPKLLQTHSTLKINHLFSQWLRSSIKEKQDKKGWKSNLHWSWEWDVLYLDRGSGVQSPTRLVTWANSCMYVATRSHTATWEGIASYSQACNLKRISAPGLASAWAQPCSPHQWQLGSPLCLPLGSQVFPGHVFARALRKVNEQKCEVNVHQLKTFKHLWGCSHSGIKWPYIAEA